MQITFVSNYINHHQLPLCLELYRLTQGNFIFLQTEDMSQERKQMGWKDSSAEYPFVDNYDDNPEGYDDLLLNADVVIFGGAEDESLIIPRLEAGKFTIRYSERLYKEGRYKFVSPRGLKKKYQDHGRFKDYPVYLLCAGAYTAGDFKLVNAYPDKMLEFGYFPQVFEYENIHELREDNKTIELMWVSRYIDWKHPYMPLDLVKRLSEEKKDFHLTMVGCGRMFDEVTDYAKKLKLSDKITFIEKDSPENVRKMMRKADIFLLTSDKGEGWGAVINEAMNSACAVVASHETGAAPVLIRQDENGLIFEANNAESLYKQVSKLMNDKDLRRSMGARAYETMINVWNPKVAAERLMSFIEDPEHKIVRYKDKGPLSKARILSFAKVKKENNL